ncbi:MAG: hypothetical protein KKF44_08205 [Nanoarchaeota archaeon]|nr:hypothetical protein [Nanoarchaeota archaeon]
MNEYGITLVSLNKTFKNNFEKYSAPYDKRINSLKYLHTKGLKTWVSIEPYPTPNLVKQDISKILNIIPFVDKIIFGKLNYNVKSNQFENNDLFYEKCADTVIDFCHSKNIEYHIKFGTKKEYNQKTEILFESKIEKPLSIFVPTY